DLRFSPDKRPYKEHLGAYLSSPRAGGVYLQFSNDGVYVAIGSHEMAPDQLTRFRDAVAGKEGEKLARIVAALVKDGYQVTEPSFKRVPAGYPADHPRGDLLRNKGLMAGRNWKPGPWLHTVEAKERLRQAIKDSKALTSWLDTQVGPSREPARQTRGRQEHTFVASERVAEWRRPPPRSSRSALSSSWPRSPAGWLGAPGCQRCSGTWRPGCWFRPSRPATSPTAINSRSSPTWASCSSSSK